MNIFTVCKSNNRKESLRIPYWEKQIYFAGGPHSSSKTNWSGQPFYLGRIPVEWLRCWRICLQCRRPGFDPWVGKIPWRSRWLPTPVFMPGEFHGQRSLAGYHPESHKESYPTERLTNIHTPIESPYSEENLFCSFQVYCMRFLDSLYSWNVFFFKPIPFLIKWWSWSIWVSELDFSPLESLPIFLVPDSDPAFAGKPCPQLSARRDLCCLITVQAALCLHYSCGIPFTALYRS